jgi:hypothetical protein
MPIEAAMIRILPALTSITLCATMTSAGADPAPFQINRGQELHSAVTDVTDAVDMSFADPKTWHSLPPAGQLDEQTRRLYSRSNELQLPAPTKPKARDAGSIAAPANAIRRLFYQCDRNFG